MTKDNNDAKGFELKNDKSRSLAEDLKQKANKINQSGPKSQLSMIASADEFYKRGADKKAEDVTLQFLSFFIDNEEYAIELRETSEIIKMRDMTEVPYTPFFIAGIISLRGNIIPVFNLHKRLGLKEKPATYDTRMVIASLHNHDEIKVALVVDKISGVTRVNPNEIEATPSIHQEAGVEFIRGVVHYDKDRIIILLDLEILIEVGKL